MRRIFLFASSLPGYAMNKDLEADISRILEESNTTAVSIAMIESDDSWHTLGIGIADTLFRVGFS